MIGLGRLYTVVFENVTYAAASGDYDFFELVPATNKPICIEALFIKTSTEVGDAQEEQIRWSIVRGHTTSGSGGSAPTPAPIMSSDAAAGFTAETSNTTIASTAGTTLHADTFNIRIGLEYIAIPEHRIVCTAADSRIVVRMLSTLADDAGMSGTAYVRELG